MNITAHFIHPTIFLSFLMSVELLIHPWRFRNVILAIFVAEMGYLTLFISLLHSNQMLNHPNLFLLIFPIETSIGPFLYLYVLSFIKSKTKFYAKDVIYFIPCIIVVFTLIPYAFSSTEIKMELVQSFVLQENYKIIQILIAIISIIVMPIIFVSLSLWHIWFRKPGENPVYQHIMLLISLLILWLILSIIGIAGDATFSTSLLKISNVATSIIIISFFLVSHKYPYLMQFGSIPTRKKGYVKSCLDKIDVSSIKNELKIIMEEEKFFCDEDLSLSRLSEALGLTRNQLSQFLNTHYKKNFNNYINAYRIEEAKKIIVEEPARQILSIALAVGFNSYSSFHSTFKKMTGQSPADFRKKYDSSFN